MRRAFLEAFGGGAKNQVFEKITLFWMEDRHLRRIEKAEGWVRVVGLGGKILFEGFAFSIRVFRVYGRDAHITVKIRPYVRSGRASLKNLGRAESVLFLKLKRSEIERMMANGERPD